MSDKKTRGRKGIKPFILKHITDLKNSHPDWTPAKIRLVLERNLKDLLIKQHPDWSVDVIDREVSKMLPVENTIYKHLREKENPGDKPVDTATIDIDAQNFDAPWSTSKTPDITADAIDAVFKVQLWAEEKNIEHYGREFPYSENKGDIYRHGISVRQALWIARLHKTIDAKKDPGYLWKVTYCYAMYEILKKDTWQLDYSLRNGKFDIFYINFSVTEDFYNAHFQLHMAFEYVPILEVKQEKEVIKEALKRKRMVENED